MSKRTTEDEIKSGLETQRDDALLRARHEFLTQKDENGDFLAIPIDFDGYIERCQNAQDRYEEDLATATDKFVEHNDVRFNLDEEGIWIRPDAPVETFHSSSGEPTTQCRFPQLSAEQKAIMVRGFERLRQQLGSDRGLANIHDKRWRKLSEAEKHNVLREFKRWQDAMQDFDRLRGSQNLGEGHAQKNDELKDGTTSEASKVTSIDADHREHSRGARDSQNTERPTMATAISWQVLRRSGRKVALQCGVLALTFAVGVMVGRWVHGGPSDRFVRVGADNARVMLDRKTGQMCWTSEGKGYQYPTCLDLYKRY